MITIKHVNTLDGLKQVVEIPSRRDQTLDGNGLFLLPGIIDSHVSCGIPERNNGSLPLNLQFEGA